MKQFLQICCCFLVASFLWGWPAEAEPVRPPMVSVELDGSKVQASASVLLQGTRYEVYAMLTDYDHLADFVPGLLESHYERISGDRVKVHQVGFVPVLFFHVKIESLLEMQEMPNRRIVFSQIEGDLLSYTGEWDFTDDADGTLVSYRAEMRFKPYVPLSIARSALQRDLMAKFTGIAIEAAARGGEER